MLNFIKRVDKSEHKSVFTPGEIGDYDLLIKRITNVYRSAHVQGAPSDVSMWKDIIGKSIDIHNAIMAGNDVAAALNNPADTNLTYGFDNLCVDIVSPFRAGDSSCASLC